MWWIILQARRHWFIRRLRSPPGRVFRVVCSSSILTIFSRTTIDHRDIILLYGASGEVHETAVMPRDRSAVPVIVAGEGKFLNTSLSSGALAFQFTIKDQTIMQLGDTFLHIMGELTKFTHFLWYYLL